VVTSLWRRACSKYSKLRGSGKSRGCKTEQTRADQSRGCRTEQTRAEHSLLNSAKQSSASTHDQGPWQYQTPAPGSGTGTLALALASAGRQCIPSRWTRVPVSERATTRIMAAAGHGNANANANGDCDARSTGATGRRLVPLRLSTYLPQPSLHSQPLPVPPLFSPPVTRPPLPLLLRSPIPPGLPRCCSADGGVQRESAS